MTGETEANPLDSRDGHCFMLFMARDGRERLSRWDKRPKYRTHISLIRRMLFLTTPKLQYTYISLTTIYIF
jgi:hypothetical protein